MKSTRATTALLLTYTTLTLAAPQSQPLQRRQDKPADAAAQPPQYIAQLTTTSTRALECKNCPYASCLNAKAYPANNEMTFSCWTAPKSAAPETQEETWVKYAYGTHNGDFCYVSATSLSEPDPLSIRSRLPHCGSRSALNFYLPHASTTTELRTECSLCPFRECPGVSFYQAGVSLDVNCVVSDGWRQVSPTHENGTSKYYRVAGENNCYVSASTVKEVPMTQVLISGSGTTAVMQSSEILPPCGPIPKLKAEDVPGLKLPAAKLAAAASARHTIALAPAVGKMEPSASVANNVAHMPTEQAVVSVAAKHSIALAPAVSFATVVSSRHSIALAPAISPAKIEAKEATAAVKVAQAEQTHEAVFVPVFIPADVATKQSIALAPAATPTRHSIALAPAVSFAVAAEGTGSI
ncbi:hypothetical protein BT63DRAFT_80293 [Microthyrium microscopicum]|uniref:Apple domain-containing protein n=1 Tax=Microthyrium microscopicum TaxID=703497 RepID=A0A6A6U1W2_9PEZI|nr:hypothetical protein BT63DRAFT_80293 [Microthyrium microscopicum]